MRTSSVSRRKRLTYQMLLVGCAVVLSAGCNRGGNETPAPTDAPPAAEAPAATEAPTAMEEAEATPEQAEEATEAAVSANESPLPSAIDSPLPSAIDSPLPSALESPVIVADEPAPESSTMVGQILTLSNGVLVPLRNNPVRLAPVFLEPQTNEKIYILSGATSPGGGTDANGVFTVSEFEPGEYVMIVGDVIGYHEVISDPEGNAIIFETEPGKIFDTGVIQVSLFQ